ncbi:CFEM domain-containing [Cordyceps militaris]|uniref:CFEM domain-containing n=1 Tax=Cordyceps militaris TaxID=73501 RepID=A0A2H4SUU2_CORMI|nr:CFEM domain-containing [Cordyceps militaris]
MTVMLKHFTVEQKQAYVLVATTTGLVLAYTTYLARLYARFTFNKKLYREDWWMELSVGLGHNIKDVSKPDLEQFMLALWCMQRMQQPTLFCIKTSIILFYIRIFDTPRFKLAALILWIYTLLWAIGVWFATLFECRPISFFWDKNQAGGSCIKDPLITIGLPSGVSSCIGDLVILALPIPMLRKLQLNPKKKAGLMGIFLVGLVVVCISFIRWVALLGTHENITSSQVEAGVWTSLEGSIGIMCANLPALAQLCRRWLSASRSVQGNEAQGWSETLTIGSAQKRRKPGQSRRFSMIDSQDGSQIELANRVQIAHGAAEARAQSGSSDRIHVQTDLAVEYCQVPRQRALS